MGILTVFAVFDVVDNEQLYDGTPLPLLRVDAWIAKVFQNLVLEETLGGSRQKQ